MDWIGRVSEQLRITDLKIFFLYKNIPPDPSLQPNYFINYN